MKRFMNLLNQNPISLMEQNVEGVFLTLGSIKMTKKIVVMKMGTRHV